MLKVPQSSPVLHQRREGWLNSFDKRKSIAADKIVQQQSKAAILTD